MILMGSRVIAHLIAIHGLPVAIAHYLLAIVAMSQRLYIGDAESLGT